MQTIIMNNATHEGDDGDDEEEDKEEGGEEGLDDVANGEAVKIKRAKNRDVYWKTKEDECLAGK